MAYVGPAMTVAVDLLLIFTLRLLDVGMSTVRIVLVGRGKKGTASAIGFFESLIWVLAVVRVLDGIDDPLRMVAFAAGFASGTYFGSIVEEWLALGQSLIRVVAPVASEPVAPLLRGHGYPATVLNGDGMAGEVRVTFCVLPRRAVPDMIRLIHKVNPAAFVTVDQTATVDLAARAERDGEK